MEMIKVVMIGDVDSGKSTLIGRMLYETDSLSLQAKNEFDKITKESGAPAEFAHLLDSFEEERKGEFTLDTTQAFLKTKKSEFLLIDVPGHKQLLKNMLTGSSYAEAAVLVIDINKSLQEQTKRHLYLLKFLRIDLVAVVINKIDSVNYSQDEFSKVELQIKNFLDNQGIKVANVIPVSARTGENLVEKSKLLNWHKGFSFIQILARLKKKENEFDFRFPVQDVYQAKRERVLAGMAVSGKARKGELLKVLPLDIQVKLKAIKVFKKTAPIVSSGQSVGLVLDNFSPGITRGQIIYRGKAPNLLTQVQAKIFCFDNLNIDDKLSINCSTQETEGRIRSIKECIDTSTWQRSQNPISLKPFDAADVIIKTIQPLVAEKFNDLPSLGRIILKKENKVLAIGIII